MKIKNKKRDTASRFIFLILAAAMVFALTGCGQNIIEPPSAADEAASISANAADEAISSGENENADPSATSAPAPTQTQSETVAAFEAADEDYFIMWDAYSVNSRGGAPEVPTRTEIVKKLNEIFGVELDSLPSLDADFMQHSYVQRMINNGSLPDIISRNHDWDLLVESGAVREIPRAMIENYAPNYAAMLSTYDYLLDGEVYFTTSTGTVTGVGSMEETEIVDYNIEYINSIFKIRDYIKYMLIPFAVSEGALEYYSCYRLDWLEQVGVEPKGELFEVAEGVYFTEEAFEADEFLDIMKRFISNGLGTSGKTYGFSLFNDAGSDWYYTNPLMGMFGISYGPMYENGLYQNFYSTDAFYDYIDFMVRLRDDELINRSNNAMITFEQGNDGWRLIHLNQINQGWLSIFRMRKQNEEAKLLLTPPEAGYNGNQGVPGWYDGGVGTTNPYFFINANVSDAKLAKILQIYDAVSFDPELWVLTNYGVEGEDFIWLGAPYESGVEMITPFQSNRVNGIGLFATGMMDGSAGRKTYEYISRDMYRFASSARGRAMNIKPAKWRPTEDASLRETEAELRERYPVSHHEIATKYYKSVILGEKELYYTWDAYIDELKSAGLDEWNEFNATLPDLR